jgi:hypothetical protein
VLFGGDDFNPLADTWEWDGSTWSKAPPLPASPPPRWFHSMVYDGARARTVLFGGANQSYTMLADTWEWGGTSWAKLTPAVAPSARFQSALAFDAARARALLFGGFSAPYSGAGLSDTWEWDGTNWLQQTASTSPPGRGNHAIAFDSVRGRMVLFGGQPTATGSYLVTGPIGDTWEWDGTTWTELNPAAGPSPRGGHAMVFDRTRARTLLFGGRNVTGAVVNDTWEWDGTDWERRLPAASPSGRMGHVMVYDDARGRTLLFGGYDSITFRSFGDTWEWDGTNWIEHAPQISPPGSNGHAMAYDSARREAVLFGGPDTYVSSPMDQTWILRVVGSPCSSSVPCNLGFCVDGVCCAKAACGTCESCNGAIPGSCAAVPAFSSDLDTCAAPGVCGPSEHCGSANGTACAFGAVCASGFCVQGVCCDSLCNGPCDVCAKSLGAAVDGSCLTPTTCTASLPPGAACQADAQCGSKHCVDGVCCSTACDGACVACNVTAGSCTPVTAGSDPRGSCRGETGCSGTCDGAGACAFPPSGTHCDTCKSCDAAGHCNQLPSDEDDATCGTITCAALSSECSIFADVTMRRCAAVGLCAAPNDPTTCVASTPVPDGQPCSGGSCRAGRCMPAPAPSPMRPPSGCSFSGGGALSVGGLPWMVLAWACGRRRRRRPASNAPTKRINHGG